MRLSTQLSRRRARLELSMTGMIDVVFLLLIFFLVTSAFIPIEHQMASTIKYETQAANQRQSDLEIAVVEMTVAEGQVVFRMGGVVTRDRRELRRVLEQFPNKMEGAIVRAADEVLADSVAKTIADCKSAGFNNVTYIPLDP